MASTYLIEVTDDARTGKLVLPVQKPDIQRPAIDFVFDVLGAPDPGRLGRELHLTPSDVALLARLQKTIFERDGDELVIRDHISFEANNEILDPDAMLEEYFVPRRRPGSDAEIYVCAIEVVAGGDDRAQKRQMLQFQLLFMLHRFKKGYGIKADEVDLLRGLTEEAESRGLLQFDMGKSTFVLTPDGEQAYKTMVDEAQELIKRFDIYADVDMEFGGDVFFGTGSGQDLRVPVYQLAGIDPFRARFILGLNDGEWDNLEDWPRRILSPAWFDEIFAYVEQCPTIDDIGRRRLEQVHDAGRRELRGDPDDE